MLRCALATVLAAALLVPAMAQARTTIVYDDQAAAARVFAGLAGDPVASVLRQEPGRGGAFAGGEGRRRIAKINDEELHGRSAAQMAAILKREIDAPDEGEANAHIVAVDEIGNYFRDVRAHARVQDGRRPRQAIPHRRPQRHRGHADRVAPSQAHAAGPATPRPRPRRALLEGDGDPRARRPPRTGAATRAVCTSIWRRRSSPRSARAVAGTSRWAEADPRTSARVGAASSRGWRARAASGCRCTTARGVGARVGVESGAGTDRRLPGTVRGRADPASIWSSPVRARRRRARATAGRRCGASGRSPPGAPTRAILENGPGAYRLGADADEWVAGYRAAF